MLKATLTVRVAVEMRAHQELATHMAVELIKDRAPKKYPQERTSFGLSGVRLNFTSICGAKTRLRVDQP